MEGCCLVLLLCNTSKRQARGQKTSRCIGTCQRSGTGATSRLAARRVAATGPNIAQSKAGVVRDYLAKGSYTVPFGFGYGL